MLIHPEVRTRELVSAVIASAEGRLSKLADQPVAGTTMETVAYGEDNWLSMILNEHGYTRQEALDVYMRRSLDAEIEKPKVIDGYTIRLTLSDF